MVNNTLNTTQQYLPRDVTKEWLMWFVYNLPLILLGLLTICANGTILVVFIRNRPLKIATNFFLVAIAFSDLMAGLIGIPTYMACNASYGFIKYVCESHGTFFTFTSLCTIGFIAVITADRYIAIMKSLRYKSIMTKKRAKTIIAVVMASSLILSLLPHFWVTGKLHSPTADQRRADLIYTICILFPIVTVFPFMVYAYIRIFMEIRRQHKLTSEHERLSGNESNSIEKEIRTICMFVIMMLGYVFCWTPLAVIRVNLYISNSYGLLSPLPRYIVMSLPFVTSFLNPCCYGLGKRDFRCALSKTSSCYGVCQRRQQQRRNNTCTTVC